MSRRLSTQGTQSRCEVGKDSIQGVAEGMAVPIHRHKDLYTEYDGDEENPALPRNRTWIQPRFETRHASSRSAPKRTQPRSNALGRTQDKDCTLLPLSLAHG